MPVLQQSQVEPLDVPSVYTGEVKKRIALVGKGLTFDSGGYNLKVAGMIELMKFDMGGAGAVFGAAQIIADLKPAGVEVS